MPGDPLNNPAIEVTGSGPDLVLLHGWGMNRAVWRQAAGLLSRRWRLHLVDLPGHGESRQLALTPDLPGLAAIVAERVPPAAWVGWSMGGLVSLQAALDFPGRVSSLILVATNPSFVNRPHWPEGVDEEVFRDFARELGRDFEGTLNRFLVLETLGSDTARETLKELRADLHAGLMPDEHALRSGLSILQDTDYSGDLQRIGQRTLWLAGGRDRLVPPAAMQRAASMMEHGIFERIRGAGHAPFIGHAESFADALERFLLPEKVS